MLISGSLLAFIAPKCIPNVTVIGSKMYSYGVNVIVYPTCVSPPFEDCSLQDLAFHVLLLQDEPWLWSCTIEISTCGDREFMLKSLVDLLLEPKYQAIVNRTRLSVYSLYNDFNVSRSVFDIFWGRGTRTDLYHQDVKHGLKVDMQLWYGKLYDRNNGHRYSNHPSELPFDRFGDACNISELAAQNITDLLIFHTKSMDITQLLSDLIDIKTCFKVYNISDSLLVYIILISAKV